MQSLCDLGVNISEEQAEKILKRWEWCHVSIHIFITNFLLSMCVVSLVFFRHLMQHLQTQDQIQRNCCKLPSYNHRQHLDQRFPTWGLSTREHRGCWRLCLLTGVAPKISWWCTWLFYSEFVKLHMLNIKEIRTYSLDKLFYAKVCM